jgi:ubiquitin fusion degradation protein 1
MSFHPFVTRNLILSCHFIIVKHVYISEVTIEKEPKFTPFTGSGRRLDGKPSKDKDALASSPAKRQANASNGVQPSTGSTSQSRSSRKTTGKLVFGSGGSRGDKVGI